MASIKYNTFHKGLNEGVQKGMEQGIERRIQQGKEETENNYIANMLKKGLAISLISEITGVHEEKIMQIKEKI